VLLYIYTKTDKIIEKFENSNPDPSVDDEFTATVEKYANEIKNDTAMSMTNHQPPNSPTILHEPEDGQNSAPESESQEANTNAVSNQINQQASAPTEETGVNIKVKGGNHQHSGVAHHKHHGTSSHSHQNIPIHSHLKDHATAQHSHKNIPYHKHYQPPRPPPRVIQRNSYNPPPNYNYNTPGIVTTQVNLKDYIHKTLVPARIDLGKYILKTEIPTPPKVPNMSKYLLKSEIPPPKNMSKFILKSEVPTCPAGPDMDRYIRKSAVPACPNVPDMSKFLLKSSLPPPRQCPSCINSCPSPCKMVKKVISCKKAPLVCAPINQPAARAIITGHTTKSLVSGESSISTSESEEIKKASKIKVSSSKKKYIKNVNKTKNLSNDLLSYKNIKDSSISNRNIKDSSISNRKTSISNIKKNINKARTIHGSSRTNNVKTNLNVYRPKKCTLTNKIVKKSGVYGPF
jgi:hypothetical protein